MHDPQNRISATRTDDGHIVVRVPASTARAADIAEATARWLSAVGLSARARREDGTVELTIDAGPDEVWEQVACAVADALAAAGDEGFAVLGRWNSTLRTSDSVRTWALAQAALAATDHEAGIAGQTRPTPAALQTQLESVDAPVDRTLLTPAALDTQLEFVGPPADETLPDRSSAGNESPFQMIGAPTVDMPDAADDGRFSVSVTALGDDAERTIALLARILKTTPEELAPKLDATPALLATDQSARDVRRILHAMAATDASFRWDRVD